MTQLEFDKMMNVIRQEHQEKKEMICAEINEIEGRMAEARERYKAICNEIVQKRKELKVVNAEYDERKKNLIMAFPKAYGTPTEKPLSMRDCHAMRRSMIAQLQEELKGAPGIDIEHINVQFVFDGENVTFETVIPKKQ